MLNFALFGVGRFGKNHARVLLGNAEVVLKAIVARSAESFKDLDDSLPEKVARVTDPQKIWSDKSIDCVLVATPISTHFEVVSAALKAGKHVLVEKPMTANAKEARTLHRLAQKNGKILMVAYQFTYNDYIRHLKQSIEAGKLGRVRYVFSTHTYPATSLRRSDAGIFLDAGTHDLALILHLLRPGPLAKVCAAKVDIRDRGIEDFASVTLSFKNGPVASLLVSGFAAEKRREVTLVGERGIAYYNDVAEKNKLKYYFREYPQNPPTERQAQLKLSTELENIAAAIPDITASEPLQNELNHFVDCVLHAKTPTTDSAFGAKIMQWHDAIARAIK